MQVITDPAAMRVLAEGWRRDGRRIAFVPTMGYLHAGHVALLAAGRARADVLVLSIFVNPIQFGPNEDLERYPRDPEGDLAKARGAGTDVVFMPEVAAMYPPGATTRIDVGPVATGLCGDRRPGHFAGVATVVTKLFQMVQPHVAFFGEKDYQQLVVIRQMVRDLDLGVAIVGCPIVREPDGLAMSSRNVYLSPDERSQALAISRALSAAEEQVHGGERDPRAIEREVVRIVSAEPLARIDYVEVRDAETLAPITRLDSPAVLAVAIFFGRTRLLDNRKLYL
jgi:pantoate--beta-alanine ligase